MYGPWSRMQLGMRRAVKEAVSSVLERSGGRNWLGAIQRRRSGGCRVQIFAWHRIVPDFEGMRKRVIPGMLTSTRTFERQLDWVARTYRIATLDFALEVLAGREKSDRDLCVITFDDGYADLLEHAVPILRRHGAPAIVYVSSGHVDSGEPLLHDRLYRLLKLVGDKRMRPGPGTELLARASSAGAAATLDSLLERHPRAFCLRLAENLERSLGEDPRAAAPDCRLLGWDELRAVQAAGVQVGAHTIDHRCLPNESLGEGERQLRIPMERIEAELGTRVRHFAYPNGWYSKQAMEQLAAAGYRSAVTTEDRPTQLGANPYALPRKCVWEYTSRGLSGYSSSVNSCNLDGTLGLLGGAIGIPRWVPGERHPADRSHAGDGSVSNPRQSTPLGGRGSRGRRAKVDGVPTREAAQVQESQTTSAEG